MSVECSAGPRPRILVAVPLRLWGPWLGRPGAVAEITVGGRSGRGRLVVTPGQSDGRAKRSSCKKGCAKVGLAGVVLIAGYSAGHRKPGLAEDGAESCERGSTR